MVLGVMGESLSGALKVLPEDSGDSVTARRPRRWALGLAGLLVVAGFVLLSALIDGEDTTEGAAASEATCIVTVPKPTAIAPIHNSEAVTVPAGSTWYGDANLATFLPEDGAVWTDLPKAEGRLSQKLFFWSEGYSSSDELQPPLELEAVLLDSSDGSEVVYPPATHGFRDDWGSFIVAGIELGSSGCWEVRAEYKGSRLTFIVDVRS